MTNRVEIVKYDEQWNALETQHFEYVEAAQAWAEAQASEKLEWNDTQVGLEGTDSTTQKSIEESGDYPITGHPIYQITGYDEDGGARELETEDWDPAFNKSTFLIINKGSMEVYERSEMGEVEFIVGRPSDEIGWQLKRTGRYDREDGVIVVIMAKPQGEEPLFTNLDLQNMEDR